MMISTARKYASLTKDGREKAALLVREEGFSPREAVEAVFEAMRAWRKEAANG